MISYRDNYATSSVPCPGLHTVGGPRLTGYRGDLETLDGRLQLGWRRMFPRRGPAGQDACQPSQRQEIPGHDGVGRTDRRGRQEEREL